MYRPAPASYRLVLLVLNAKQLIARGHCITYFLVPTRERVPIGCIPRTLRIRMLVVSLLQHVGLGLRNSVFNQRLRRCTCWRRLDSRPTCSDRYLAVPMLLS